MNFIKGLGLGLLIGYAGTATLVSVYFICQDQAFSAYLRNRYYDSKERNYRV